MFYKFSFHTLKIMSDTNYINITEHREMLTRYHEEQDIELKNRLFLPEEYKKAENDIYMTSIMLGIKTQAYICLTSDQKFVYLVKDKDGFRFDISEQEFQRFIKGYEFALNSLRSKINNHMSLNKFTSNQEVKDTILGLMEKDAEFRPKVAGHEYERYEYESV